MSQLVGTLVDRVSFTVEQGKILELARATGATSTSHQDGLATATHVVVAGHHRDQQGLVEALGLDLTRVVVGSVTWEYDRPLRAGDDLVGTRVVVADETREGRRGTNRLVTLETEYAVGGEVVVRQREVLIERGRS